MAGRDHGHSEAVVLALARGLSALDIRAGHHPLDQTPGRGPAHMPQRRVPVRFPAPAARPLAGAQVEHQVQAFNQRRRHGHGHGHGEVLRRGLTLCAVYLALFEAAQYTSARSETKTRPTVN